MAKSQETWNKKEVRTNKEKKRKEKDKKKIERRENEKGGSSLDDMIAYVDENGQLTSTPPDPKKRIAVDIESIEVSVPKHKAAEPEDLIRKGVVSFFDDAKGYGFIQDNANQDRVFIHRNGLLEMIKEKDKVVFEITIGFKGKNAINVKLDR
jgi:cold shock CspA family protein